MFNDIENLKIISSLHRVSKQFNKIEKRKYNTFIIRTTGEVEYNFYNDKFCVKKGEMIFLPKGISYEYTTLSTMPSMYTSINFDSDYIDDKPRIYSLDNFCDIEYINNYYSHLWNLGTQAERYKCMSVFYNLLSYVSVIESSSYSEKRKFETIEPAIVYLKKHIYDCSLNINKLHQLCDISDTYFRQIFVSKFGTTPQKYVTSRRLSHAKSIIDSGDFHTLSEVAASVGFNDPLYFSKSFKKMYGVSPSDVGNL